MTNFNFKILPKELRKLRDDTLKINGKYSIDRVLVAIFTPFTLLIGTYIVISDRLLGLKTVNVYGIQVFTALLGFIIGVVITKTVKQIKELKNNENIVKE
jgi:hypothetical protein